ncbi:hypothetical protein [Luteimicrobium album]|uniref:hypothetical protein n=1 Tax=Luteimicrobium album TaxID=1054550 RepID=UPI0024E0979E|nr:hypothetical protein [Luteimicrobium album]
MTLYNDPDVMFGKEKVGGIRISHLSHIDSERSVSIRSSGAGRKKLWRVKPLSADVSAQVSAHAVTKPTDTFDPTPEEIAACNDLDVLRSMYRTASDETKALINERVAEIKGQAS